MYKIRNSEYRVGVVGPYFSGKTVLLTSLLNHLHAHEPNRFRLGDGTVEIRKFKELVPDRGWEPFNYHGHRDRLVHRQKWPEKTTDCCQYVCQFERSDWRMHTAVLKFYDLPGERVADAIMAGKDYAGWSDHILAILENDKEYGDCCREFLRTLECSAASREELLQAYRVGLAQLIVRCKPYVSPSTFFLDTKGSTIRVRTAEGTPLVPQEIVAERFAGVTADDQFAPLPRRWRDAHADLNGEFAKHYGAYRAQIVFPWLGAVKSCHALIFLVDVIEILANGHPMYNDTQQIIRDFLEILDPGQTALGAAIRATVGLFLPHSRRPGRVTRIAFVAPKLDLVYPTERDKMIELVRQLGKRLAENHDGLKALYTNCSAIVSTKELPNDGNGFFLSGHVSGEEQKFETPGLPLGWPAEWSAGKYLFPRRVAPAIPPVKDCAPHQVNLDQLLNFVME